MKKLLHMSYKPKDSFMLNDLLAPFVKEGIRFDALSVAANENSEIQIWEKIEAYDPDIVLVHHNRSMMTREFWQRLHRRCFITWWMNDERYPPASWMLTMVKYVDLWLVASIDSAEWLKEIGCDARYLIMGYTRQVDPQLERSINLCFTGQNSGERFPLSFFRRQTVCSAKRMLGPDFHVYGRGWGGIAERKKISDRVYRRAKMGLSVGHYNTRGTYSNRMLSIMGHGALCLCHRTDGLEEIFTDGEHLVYFNDIDELVMSYRYYMDHPQELADIAARGRRFVETTMRWKHKGRQILALLREKRQL